MSMEWPQLVMGGMIVFSLTVSACYHVRPHRDFNFLMTLANHTAMVVVLWAGEFWA